MIRTFQTDDLDAVMKLWLETNITAHSFIPADYWREHFTMVKAMLPQAELSVYEDGQTVRGFIGLTANYIAGIFVDAACQSQGIGKGLLDFVKHSHAELSLKVYGKNVRAMSFYQREGFAEIRRQMDKDTGEAELVMHWKR